MNTTLNQKHSSLAATARRTCLAVFALAIASGTMSHLAPDLAAQQNSSRAGNSYAGFSFLPPSGWTVSTEYPHAEIRLLYLGPTYRGFRANVNLVVEKDNGESFDEISRQVKAAFTTMFSGKTAEEGRIQIDGKETLYISSTFRSGPLSIKNAQFIVRGGNGKFYVVTFTAAADAFDSLGPAIAQSAKTIKSEKKQAPSLPKAPHVTRRGKPASGS